MEVKIGTVLIAIILIVGELNCQPINDNEDNLLINKNRDITLPNNNNKNKNNINNYSDNSSSSSSSSSSGSSESNDNDLKSNASINNKNKKTDVPLIFPEDTKNYKILPSNVTIIKKLLHQIGDSSEITDLNKPALTKTAVQVKIPSIGNGTSIDAKLLMTGRNLKTNTTTLKPNKPVNKNGDYYEDDYKSSGEEVENYSDEVENVQAKHTKKPKVELEEQFERKDNIKTEQQLPVDIQDIDNPVPFKTEAAPSSNSALFIVIVVAVAFICTTIYLSLFVWRRKLEGRYGMRERLVTNEEDVLQDDVHYRNEPNITVREEC